MNSWHFFLITHVVQFLGTCFQAVVLLKKFAITLLDVLDEAVLSRHLEVVLLQE
jgi:hypothetical protein